MPPPPGATQSLGYPPGYVPPPSGQSTGNLGYPVQGNNLGYPVQPPGMMPPGTGSVPVVMPGQSFAAPAATSGPVPVAAVPTADEGLHIHSGAGMEEVYHPPALTHFENVKPPNALVRAWRKVGGGSLTLSIAIHAGILIVGGAIVVSTQMLEKQVDFLPGGGTQQGAQASAEMQHKVQQKKRTSLNKTMPMKKIVSTSQNAAVTLPDAPPDLLDVPDVSSMLGGGSLGSGGFGKAGAGMGFGTGMGMGSMQGFVSLPPSMRSRCSPQERLKKLAESGGSPECERAVSASLEWLKQKQAPDGSWNGMGHKSAMTGLALLCYLGRCETPDSPFYGDTVMKGILYLVELSKKNPYGMICEDPLNNGSTYAHGIATYALGEMYTLARLGSKELPGMREAFEKGVKLIIENQNERGSWTYGGKDAGLKTAYTKDSKGEDLSVAGWQFQALKAAKNSGLKIQGLDSAIKKCIDYVLAKQTKDGGFGKINRDEHYNQWSLTGAGSLALQTMSKGNTAALKKSLKFLREFLTAEPLDWNKNCNPYCWYYYTQTFFQAGGDDWKFYNQQFLPQILAAQQPDGSFKKGRANWSAGDATDPVYRQALCTLMLEVYYRYLKVADRDEESFFDR
ncbi:MAG TPA: prenyltransferase/squalene oxidase repeat-containing protein [Prosthecobacter sp.]